MIRDYYRSINLEQLVNIFPEVFQKHQSHLFVEYTLKREDI